MTDSALPWLGAPVCPTVLSWVLAPRPEPFLVAAGSGGDDGVDPWEAACIRETQQGRPEAFNPLVTRYAPRIRAYLLRMVGHREEAEDLTQETFIKAFRAVARFDAERPFRSWLYAIATNTGLNAIRSRQRRGIAIEFDEQQIPASERDKGAHYGEKEEALRIAMAQLSPRAARLVALHYQEGFSLAEAGAVLDLSENAAKVALCRARKQLRAHMVEAQNDEL